MTTAEIVEAEIIVAPPAVTTFQPPAPRTASVEIEVQRATAEVQAAVVVARACPRDEAKAKQALESACKDPLFAELAFYQVPRGKDTAEGASVNLAKEAARHWGNLQYSVIDHGPVVIDGSAWSQIEVHVWDVQANSRYVKRFKVKHFRYTKNGGYALTDPTQTSDVVNAQISKELRNGIFNFIPRSLTNQLKLICDATLAAAINAKERMAKAVEFFASKQIGPEKLEKLLGKPLAQATTEDVVTLLRVGKAIEQGATIEEYFAEEQQQSETETEKTRSARKPRAPKQQEETTPEPVPAPEQAAVAATDTTTQPW